MQVIAKNLQVKYSMPGQDDFRNAYAIEACHSHVLESFKKFVKRIYDYILGFIKTFFQKVGLFLKRLIGADLKLDDYEKYLEKLITTLRDKPTTTPNKKTFQSKLPKLLISERYSHLSRNNILERCNNVYMDLNDLIKEIMPNGLYHKLVNSVIKESKEIKSYLESNKKLGLKNPELESRLNAHIENFKSILFDEAFNVSVDSSSVPDKIRDESEGNLFGIAKDRNNIKALFATGLDIPYNYNVYLAYVEDRDGDKDNNRFYVMPYTKEDSDAPLSVENMDDKKSIEMLYKSYKDFKNKYPNDKAEDSYRSIEKSLMEETKMVSSMLVLASESTDDGTAHISGQNEADNLEQNLEVKITPTENSDGSNLGLVVDKNKLSSDPAVNSNNSDDLTEEEIALINRNHDAVKQFHRFMESYINALQMVARTMLVDLISIRYTLRYEMIRYLYLCIKAY